MMKLLSDARDVITNPDRWGKVTYAVDAKGRTVFNTTKTPVCFCALGACFAAEGIHGFSLEDSPEHRAAVVQLEAAIDRLFPGRVPPLSPAKVPVFNDHADTTHAEVLAVFDNALQQVIFDTVAVKLLEQGKAAKNDFSCVYRASNGTRCAVGHLIPDDKYEPRFEGSSIDAETTKGESIRAALPFSARHCLPFLSSLQSAHDFTLSNEGTEAWIMRMKEIALRYNLSPEKLDGH